MVLKTFLLRRLLAAFADLYPGLLGSTAYLDYTKHHEFRMRVSGPTHTLFGARCWACGLTANDAKLRNNRLTTAHIVYPPEPFTEVVDPDDLTRSDVVLLCWRDHTFFDSFTQHRPFDNIDDLREFSLDVLDRMRVGYATGEDLPPNEP